MNGKHRMPEPRRSGLEAIRCLMNQRISLTISRISGADE